MEEFSLRDIINILKRQKNYGIITTVVLFVIASIVSMNWSTYRSTATVEIEQAAIPTNLTSVGGQNPNDTIISMADQRISKVEQKVTSLASLAEIITKFNLYPELREKQHVSAITERMRQKIKLQFVSSVFSDPVAAQKQTAEQLSAIAFKLSFDYHDPQLVQQVTDELVTRFLDEDLKLRRLQAQETSDFLEAQITALEGTMAEQEKAIAEFRAEHGESGTSAFLFNQQASSNIRSSIQNIETQLISNEGTQGAIRAQLALVDPYSRVIADGQVLTTPRIQLKALEAKETTLASQYGDKHPDVIKIRNQIKALRSEAGESDNSQQIRSQLIDARSNLAAAENTKGSDHPDVIILRRQVLKLEERLASAGSVTNSAAEIKRDADNPAYLQLTARLSAAQEQYKALAAQRDALKLQQTQYEQAIAANPLIEKEMAKLTRDYDNIQLRYRELKEKKMAADMNSQLEQDRKGQRLMMINPPSVPTDTQPKRIFLLLGGLLFSLVGGLTSIIIAEAMNHNVHGSHHLASLIGAAPLVCVPHLLAQGERTRFGIRKFLRRLLRFGKKEAAPSFPTPRS